MQNTGKQNYSPVKIRNPISKEHIVRLLNGQKLDLIFNKPQFEVCKLEIYSDFIQLDETLEDENFWCASFSQIHLLNELLNSNVFLGEINI